MEEKFYNRYKSYTNSLESLEEARVRDLSDSFVLSGTGAKFDITFDLAWKVMKDIIVQHYMITDFVLGSPREVLRKAFEVGLIDEDDGWIDMLKLRNHLSHDYDGEILKEACGKIVNEYISSFFKLESTVDKLLMNGK